MANNKITFDLQGNRITIANTEAFVIEPFEHIELDFKLMAFLPQIWELKESVCKESSILQGNLKCPTLDINGITLQNWTDEPITYAAGQILYSIEVGEEPETILVGNIKSEIDMRSIFKNYMLDREELMAQGFMRTILSALNCTKANLENNFDTLEQKERHITSLIQRGGLGVNVLKVTGKGAPILDFVKNRKALKRVLLSQLKR